jgi:hypothetical protein
MTPENEERNEEKIRAQTGRPETAAPLPRGKPGHPSSCLALKKSRKKARVTP